MLLKSIIESDVDFEKNYIEFEIEEVGYYDNCCVCKIDNEFYMVDLDNKIIDNKCNSFEELCEDSGWLKEIEVEELGDIKIKKNDKKLFDEIKNY